MAGKPAATGVRGEKVFVDYGGQTVDVVPSMSNANPLRPELRSDRGEAVFGAQKAHITDGDRLWSRRPRQDAQPRQRRAQRRRRSSTSSTRCRSSSARFVRPDAPAGVPRSRSTRPT